MKALSLKQPFAELVLSGKKTIELRKWNTKFRGEFYVHASQTPDHSAMKRFGYSELPTGAILGKVTLVAVKKYSSDREHIEDRNKHLANSVWGNHGFILENPKRITPIPCKGKLGFWEY